MEEIKETVGNNDPPATTFVSSMTTITENGKNITQITPQTIDNFEPDPKWEMTTLEKASFETDAQEQEDNNVFGSCILSQSSVDTDMEKVIDDIVELDRCQQFNQPIEQHTETPGLHENDDQNEQQEDTSCEADHNSENLVSKATDNVHQVSFEAKSNVQLAEVAFKEPQRQLTQDLNETDVTTKIEPTKPEVLDYQDLSPLEAIAAEKPTEACQLETIASELAEMSPVKEYQDKVEEVADTVETKCESVKMDQSVSLNCSSADSEARITHLEQVAADEVQEKVHREVTEEASDMVEEEISDLDTDKVLELVGEKDDKHIEEEEAAKEVESTSDTLDNLKTDTGKEAKDADEKLSSDEKALESIEITTSDAAKSEQSENNKLVAKNPDSTDVIMKETDVYETTEVVKASSVEENVERASKPDSGKVEKSGMLEKTMESSDIMKILTSGATEMDKDCVSETIHLSSNNQVTETGFNKLSEAESAREEEAVDRDVSMTVDSEDITEKKEDSNVEEKVDSKSTRTKETASNEEPNLGERRRSKRVKVDRKSKVEKELDAEVEKIEDVEKPAESSNEDECLSVTKQTMKPEVAESKRPVRLSRARLSKLQEPVESAQPVKKESERKPVKRSLAKEYNRDEELPKPSFKSSRLANSRATIATSEPPTESLEASRRTSCKNKEDAPYKCTHCRYASSRIDNLIYHMRLMCGPLKKMWDDQCAKYKQEMLNSPKGNKKRFSK